MQKAYLRHRLSQETLLQVEMILQGLKRKDLARLIGQNPRRITNVLCRNDKSWPVRLAINRALHKRIFMKSKGQRPVSNPNPRII
jgi:antitoxin component HigA of HigAB toxin-antitoxin module